METQAQSVIRYTQGFVSESLHGSVVAAMRAPDQPVPGEDQLASPSMTMWRRTFSLSQTIAKMLGVRAAEIQLFDLDVICFMPEAHFGQFMDSPVGQVLLIEKCSAYLDNQIKIVSSYCDLALRNDEAFADLPGELAAWGHSCEMQLGKITQQCLTDFFGGIKAVEKTKFSTKCKIGAGGLGAMATVAGVTLTSIGIAAAPFTAGATLILSGVGLGLTVIFGVRGAASLIMTVLALREEATQINTKLYFVLKDLVARIEAGAGQGSEIGLNIASGLTGGLLDKYLGSCATARDLLEQLRVSVAKIEITFAPVYKNLHDLHFQSLQVQGDLEEALAEAQALDAGGQAELQDFLDQRAAYSLGQCVQASLDMAQKLAAVTEAAFKQAQELAVWKKLVESHAEVIGEIEKSLSAGKSALALAGGKLAPTAITLTISLMTLDYANIIGALPDLGVAITSAGVDLVDTKDQFEELGATVKKHFKGTGKEEDK